MHDIWRRIETWFKSNAPWEDYLPAFINRLFPLGASDEQIRAAENKLQGERPWLEEIRRLRFPMPPEEASRVEGELKPSERLRLPDEVRQSYLIHNGCDSLFGNHELLAIDRIPGQWAMSRYRTAHVRSEYGLEWEKLRVEGPMKTLAWNPRWIPLTDTCGGVDYLCADLDPAEGGHVGQLIYVDMEVHRGKVVASGFREWLTTFADNLGAGLYRWDEHEVCVRHTTGYLFYEPSWYDPKNRSFQGPP